MYRPYPMFHSFLSVIEKARKPGGFVRSIQVPHHKIYGLLAQEVGMHWIEHLIPRKVQHV
jgi:hypothetical protein